MMEGFVKVATVGDFEEGLVRGFRVEGGYVAVVNWGGRFFAFRNQCTHSAFSFDYLNVEADGLLTCDAHGSVFQVETGSVKKGPAATDLTTYEVRVEGGDVLVGIPK